MNTKTDLLLEELIRDSDVDARISLSRSDTASLDAQEKKNLIRSLMNIRMPRALSEKLLKLQDAYLQEELEEKSIVSLSDIPTIRELRSRGGDAPSVQSRYAHAADAETAHATPVQSAHTTAASVTAGKAAVRSKHLAEKLSLWQGDITRLKVGAIVNAANSQMLGCFVPCHRCIDNAIHSAAGMQLREECHQIMTRKRAAYGKDYEEPTGTASLTGAYQLPCDYVIHTVGPIVYGDLTDALCQDLQNCYENVLKCCMEHHIRSVAFCCISTGEFHFPNEKAAEIALETAAAFLEMHGDEMERIIFNVFTDRDRRIYEKLLGLAS